MYQTLAVASFFVRPQISTLNGPFFEYSFLFMPFGVVVRVLESQLGCGRLGSYSVLKAFCLQMLAGSKGATFG